MGNEETRVSQASLQMADVTSRRCHTTWYKTTHSVPTSYCYYIQSHWIRTLCLRYKQIFS